MKRTIQDIAKGLDLPVDTIDRWARQGRIPAQRNEVGWSFDDQVIQRWAKSHQMPFSIEQKKTATKVAGDDADLLQPAMQRGGVFYDIEGGDVPTVLARAIEHVPQVPEDMRPDLLKTMLEREELSSTGIGKGVAIPHPRTPILHTMTHPVITTCFLKTPIDYQAVDDRPVFVLFLLLSTSVKTHLNLLSRLAFCMRDEEFYQFLKSAPKESDLLERVAVFERRMDSADVI